MRFNLQHLVVLSSICLCVGAKAEGIPQDYSIEVVDSNKDLIVQRNVYVEENNVKYLIEPNTGDWYYHHYYKEIYKVLDLDGEQIEKDHYLCLHFSPKPYSSRR